MKGRRALLFSLLALLSAAGQGGVAKATGPSDPAELEAFVDGAMRALMESHKAPGATLSVVKDGEILLAKGYGYADVAQRVPVDAESTLFRIASVSKLFTWTALMQLAERGEIDLEEDVNSYLDFEIPPTFPQPITPKHLLTHTAGFEDRYRGLFGDGIEDLGPLRDILANNIPARVFPPGRESAYSNYGAALAGYLVERISGMPFEQYVEERIQAPLDMRHSTFRQPVPAEMERDLAIGYAWRDGGYEAQAFEYDPAIADGAMSTSAVDMAHFMLAHLRDGRYGARRILREETAKQMRRRIFGHGPRIAGMAYGFYEIDLNGQRGIGHGGDLFYFHTDLLLLPEHDLGLFVSFNSDSGSRARDEIVRLFLDRYYPTSEGAPAEPPADFAARASRYTGRYRVNRYPHETLEKTALLAFGDGVVSAPESGGLLLELMGEHARLAEIEPLLFRVVSGELALGTDRVAFGTTASGEVDRLFAMPVMILHKLAWYDTVLFQRGLLALCLAIFAAAAVSASWRLVTRKTDSPLVRWRYRAIVGLGVVHVAFAVGFGAMLLQSMDTALIPESVSYLLFLPVASIALTLCIASLVA
ncbi:MAG TPA: serine hydrolase domain-containing protein, partial [Myxococcota bacterium]